VDEYLEFLVSNRRRISRTKNITGCRTNIPPRIFPCVLLRRKAWFCKQQHDDGRPTIGTVDGESAAWMVHPGAIYMHEAQQYFVQELNLENHIAQLIPVGLDYYTEAQQRSEIQVLSVNEQRCRQKVGRSLLEGLRRNSSHHAGGRIQKIALVHQRKFGRGTFRHAPVRVADDGLLADPCLKRRSRLRESGAWTNDPNDYGPDWQKIRLAVRKRDQFKCQVCGAEETNREHDVHHKIPFRAFTSAAEANRLENLTTLCRTCHQKVEQNVRMRSGLAGLGFALGNLAPLFLMCDPRDLGIHTDPAWSAMMENRPSSCMTLSPRASASAKNFLRSTMN
jgi:DEAD/DEAH box helicase domain-containing protein